MTSYKFAAKKGLHAPVCGAKDIYPPHCPRDSGPSGHQREKAA